MSTIAQDLMEAVNVELNRLDQPSDRITSRIRMGRETFLAIAGYASGGHPSEDLKALARDHGGRFVDLYVQELERYYEGMLRALDSWGKDGSQFLGIAIECVEGMEGFEVIIEPMPAHSFDPVLERIRRDQGKRQSEDD